MPPYFNFSLQFLRQDLYPGFMAEFDAHLERCGLRFKAGFWNGEGETQAEIAAANQAKLEADLEWTCEDHHPYGHKQILYDCNDHSEVRGIWYSRYPSEDTFNFDLIIPEYEVLTWEDTGTFHPERAAELLTLAKKLWQFPAVRAIQTGLECCDASVSLTAVQRGQPPNVVPFTILEPDCLHFSAPALLVEELTEGRPGLLLLRSGLISYTLPQGRFGPSWSTT